MCVKVIASQRWDVFWDTVYNVIDILYNRIWFIRGFCILFTDWPAGSAVSVPACEVNAKVESCLGHFVFLLHFTFNLIKFFPFHGSVRSWTLMLNSANNRCYVATPSEHSYFVSCHKFRRCTTKQVMSFGWNINTRALPSRLNFNFGTSYLNVALTSLRRLYVLNYYPQLVPHVSIKMHFQPANRFASACWCEYWIKMEAAFQKLLFLLRCNLHL